MVRVSSVRDWIGATPSPATHGAPAQQTSAKYRLRTPLPVGLLRTAQVRFRARRTPGNG